MKKAKHTENDADVALAGSPLAGERNADLADALKRAYCSLAAGNTSELGPLYSDDVYFEDPSHGIQGKAALI